MNSGINKKRLYLSILIVGIVILIGGLYYFLLVNHLFSIPCFFHTITGYYCPGCGITRVFLSIIQLDIYQAFRYNPLIFCMIPFGLFYGFLSFKYWLYNKDYLKIDDKIWYSFLILTIVFGILRNTELFIFLAPTIV